MRERIQKEALQALIQNKGGTLCLEVGTGKSKIALDYVKHSKAKYVLITSPRTNLQDNWEAEIARWGPFGDVSFDLVNIQTSYKYLPKTISGYDLIIADEIHTMATLQYGKLLNLAKTFHIPIIGLTGTPELHKEDKKNFYDNYCPIVYSYFKSAEDGLVNKTKYIIYEHTLDNIFKVNAGTKKVPFLRGEKDQYEYLSKQLKLAQQTMMSLGSKDWFSDARDWGWLGKGNATEKAAAIRYLNAIKYRKNFLWNLQSTASIARQLADNILTKSSDSKILFFSELTAQTDSITKFGVHSNKDSKVNSTTIASFNKGDIREMGSVRSLQLGLNLTAANWAIFESYNGSPTGAKQSQGRLQRLNPDLLAKVIIIRVKDTQYDTWFNSFSKHFNLKDSIIISSISEFNSLSL